jgi:Holliday junction DNA helicase RuvA
MIGRLTGLVEAGEGNTAIVDVNGVGYLVQCSARTLAVAVTGGPVRMNVETQVREDAITLYAFAIAGEQAWFKLLTSVQGVGGRVALQILSALTLDELAASIMADDKKTISRADGVGPKLAQRIISVLQDKVASGAISAPALASATGADGGSGGGAAPSAEAISALSNLGYGRAEAYAAVGSAEAALGPDAALPQLIAAALKEAAGA